MPLPSLAELIEQSGKNAPAFFDKNSEIGDSITGVVTGVEIRQTRDPKDNKPQVWEDGSPRQQIVVTLATELRDDNDDDGERTVYVKWWTHQRKAFLEAIAEAKVSDLNLGDEFTAEFVSTIPSTRKSLNDTKVYKYTIAPQ